MMGKGIDSVDADAIQKGFTRDVWLCAEFGR